MGVLEIGVAAGGEGAQQVERRGRLAIGVELAAWIGLARCRSELDVVDDVAAVARQRHAVDRIDSGRARLGELASDAPDLDDRRSRRERHHHRHLQEDAEEVADVVGRMLAETLGAVSALQQESLAGGGGSERALELAGLAREHERRVAREAALGVGQGRLVPVDRRLLDRLRPPAVRRPTCIRHSQRLCLALQFLQGAAF